MHYYLCFFLIRIFEVVHITLFFSVEGQKKVDLNELVESVHMIDSLAVENGGKVEYGGWFEPQHCKPRAKVMTLQLTFYLFLFSFIKFLTFVR